MLEKVIDKKNLGIYLFANKKFLFALGTFIINLQEKFNKYDCIVIYHEDLDDNDINNIKKIENRTKFIKYTMKDFCEEFSFSEEIGNNRAIKRFTILSITRFNVFKYLREFKTVILFECDMLLMDDISELLSKEYNIAWKTDKGSTILSKILYCGYDHNTIKKLDVYDIYQKAITPNVGFLIINDNFDYELAYKTAFEYFKKYFPIHPFLIGEYTFAYLKYVLNLKLLEVDQDIYNVIPISFTLKSKLIHFFSEYKPWKKEFIQYIFRPWIDNYFKYVKITNDTSKEVKIFENIGKGYINYAYTRERYARLFERGFHYPKCLKLRPTLFDNVISLDYDKYITYDIISPIFLDPLYNCRIWILCKDEYKKKLFENELQQILHDNIFFIYLKYKLAIGCQTKKVNVENVQDNFNLLYTATEKIRQLSDSILAAN